MTYKDLLTAYETDVQFPDVSGMEHLDMLMRRSELSQYESHLSDGERQRLETADKQLLQQAAQFYAAIRQVADLASWRRDENAPPAHWWWYLDVVTQMPLTSEALHTALTAAD